MQTVPRLINQFVPENYNLSLTLDRINRHFGGIVTIIGASTAKNRQIIFHAKELDVKAVVIDGKAASFKYGENDELIISHKDLTPGKHIIVIDYGGTITDSMNGIYPCYFTDDGIKKELLATHFEPHYARQVFPCIDEPAAKATFDVTLTTETGIIVLGNMPIKKQSIENGQLVTTFNTTPIMSSYLLAWVVGELHKASGKTKDGVEVNIWATPAQSSASLDFALDIAIRSIEFYDKYFGVPYPLPKSDHVALPDFSQGAMENWGLVVYREVALLSDPKTTSISTKQYVSTVIAHELSHQWFGNLVTMEWWNDLWLNESFATLIEYIAIDALEPSWNIWQDFSSLESVTALRRDSLAGVQPVQTDVNHPDEISTLFDGAIVYAKGARLLQMLRHYIGEKAFRTGLKKYFETYAYKNTTDHDLWSALSESSGKDIESFMSKWLSQPGFPILHASELNGKLTLSQERLVNIISNKSDDSLWPITINSSDSKLPILFDTKKMEIMRSSPKPLRFNVDSNAHFITDYDNDMFDSIVNQISNGELSPIDRLQFLNEQNILANAGIINNSRLINLLSAFKNETIESVWDIISLTIGELKKFTDDDNLAEAKLRQLAADIAGKQYARLGWIKLQNEPETDTKLRSTILGLMLYAENPDVISTAIKLFHTNKIDNLDPELISIILTAVVRHEAKPVDIKMLIKEYSTTESAELKQDICGSLTAVRDSETIGKLLALIKNTAIIRPQDTARWLVYLLRNKYGRVIVWQWIRDNWSWIDSTFSDDKSYDDYPRYAAAILSTKKQFQEYQDFFEPMLSNPALTRVINMGINEIKNRISVIDRDGESVKKTLLNL